MITPKQKELLSFIKEYLAEHGVTPSYDEMKDGLGLHSKSGIHRLVSGLEERGYITRLPNRARAIEVHNKRILSESRAADLLADICSMQGVWRMIPQAKRKAIETELGGLL